MCVCDTNKTNPGGIYIEEGVTVYVFPTRITFDVLTLKRQQVNSC